MLVIVRSVFFLCWCCERLKEVLALPSVYIIDPSPSSFFHLPPGERKLTFPFQYHLYGEEENDWQVCVEVTYQEESGQVYLPRSCLPPLSGGRAHDIALPEIRSGGYELRCYLKPVSSSEILSETLITTRFRVLTYEEAVPRLSIPHREVILAADLIKQTADVTVEYALDSIAIDAGGFTVCVEVMNSLLGTTVLSWTCLGAKDRSFLLQNLAIGQYEVNMILDDQRPKSLEEEKQSKLALLQRMERVRITIKSLTETWPTIQPDHSLVEYGVNPPISNTTTVKIGYHLEAIPGVIQQCQVCINLFQNENSETGIDDSSKLIAKGCIASDQVSFTLTNLPEGVYHAKLFIRIVQSREVYAPDVKTVTLVIRHMEEFAPTYDWQPLHAWHTIPSGAETRLPIGGEGKHKEVRIPQPWRLQLTMPSPCKHFLRMNIQRLTTMEQIVMAAQKQCTDYELICFYLVVDGSPVKDMKITAEEIDLFNRKTMLAFDSSCI
eukprot:scaffold671_cov186-Ochromonas_danica.AAC.1